MYKVKPRPDVKTKPYYKCMGCSRFRVECGGIPTRAMDLKNWCEYMRDLKEYAHLSNAYISDTSDTSISTIERIMALNADQDILRATARRIELAVIGDFPDHICCIDFKDLAAADTIAFLNAEIASLKEENIRKGKIIDKLLEAK